MHLALCAVESGCEPAFEAWLQRNDLQFGGDSIWQSQSYRAEAWEQASITEGGDRKLRCRGGRWSSPQLILEKVEWLGTRRDQDGVIGGPAVGCDHLQVQSIAGVGCDRRLGHQGI